MGKATVEWRKGKTRYGDGKQLPLDELTGIFEDL